jgi:hypothetical protein
MATDAYIGRANLLDAFSVKIEDLYRDPRRFSRLR